MTAVCHQDDLPADNIIEGYSSDVDNDDDGGGIRCQCSLFNILYLDTSY